MTKDLLNLEGGEGTNGNLDPNTNGAGADPNSGAGGDSAGAAGSGTNNNNNGDFAKNWKDFIPEEVKDRAEWNNIKDVSDLFKNYISSQQYISKSVRIPDETSSPEDIASFYTKLGKPQSKTDYTFEYTPKENYVYNKDSFDFTVFQDIAEKANLTTKQYPALASAYIDANNENYI